MPRRYAESDYTDERYDDRRSDYPPRSNGRGRGGEERYYEEDIEYTRTRGPPVREREREREREEVIIRTRPPPDFLRDDYGRTSAGPVVLRKRETEEYDFIPNPRRRSPSPEPERKVERKEIIIRRDSPSPPPRREPPPIREREREEIIIRRDERVREPEAPPPPPIREREREEIIIRRDEREREPSRRRDDYDREPSGRRDDYERDEIIIRRDERVTERRPPPPREVERGRDEVIIKRDEGGRRSKVEIDFEKDDDRYERRRAPPSARDYDREEIIIRRDERDDSDRASRVGSRTYDDYPPVRPKSHERERSRAGDDEIIIRHDEGGGRRGDRDREEIIIRRKESRSPSPASSVHAPPEPPIIRAPPIHQEIITHHRHIDHGYELAVAPARAPARPPSPPSPPRAKSEERIDIHRSGVRNGRAYDEDIIIDRNEGARSAAPRPPPSMIRDDSPPPPASLAPARRPPPPQSAYRGYDIDAQEEADYYNARALERSYVGEGYNGATRDWAIVDVPPGTRRVEMDGVGGGRQEITWQRYNGVRRSKFIPEAGSDEGYGSEIARPAPASSAAPAAGGGEIGRSYGPRRDPTAGLWTEITKDLVIREAIVESGYEFTETEDFYYIIAYLDYDGVARLVGLSDDIKRDRKRRAQEMEREVRFFPEEPPEPEPVRLAIEAGPPRRERGPPWEAEEERYIEREVVYRGGRPPPPVEYRRY